MHIPIIIILLPRLGCTCCWVGWMKFWCYSGKNFSPGGTPEEIVDEVTVPMPAPVMAATSRVYVVREVRPVTLYSSVLLGMVRATRDWFFPCASQDSR